MWEMGEIPCADCRGTGVPGITDREISRHTDRGDFCTRCHGRGEVGPHKCPTHCDKQFQEVGS